MTRQALLTHEFVERIPQELREDTVYVCIPFATVVHKCCCGCGLEVVTPLSPTDWRLVFDGETISLDPSVGNWGFPCRSHYWIRENRVKWAAQWSQREIEASRARDRRDKHAHFERPAAAVPAPTPAEPPGIRPRPSLWSRVRKRLRF